MIEVLHNADVLPARIKLKLADARGTYKKFEKFMSERRPRGLRVRHALDLPTSSVHLEARTGLALETAIRFFKNTGNIKWRFK